MNSPETRDEGLSRVRRLTLWLAGGSVVIAGAFGFWLSRPQSSSATTTTNPAATSTPATVAPKSSNTNRTQAVPAPKTQQPARRGSRSRAS